MADVAATRQALFPPQRQQEILRLTRTGGRVDVADLATAFAVTTETIRRDLSDLQRRRLVRRVHGGAIPWDSGRFEPLIEQRDIQRVDEKQRIACLAVAELPSTGAVILDSGSTTARVAERIPSDCSLTVVTNSVIHAQLLHEHRDTNVVVLGGALDKNTMAMVDAQTIAQVRELTVDTLVFGTDGISAEGGLTTPYRSQAELKRAMLAAARRVVLVADHSKVDDDQLIRFASCAEIDLFVTDADVDDEAVARLESAGVAVVRA